MADSLLAQIRRFIPGAPDCLFKAHRVLQEVHLAPVTREFVSVVMAARGRDRRGNTRSQHRHAILIAKQWWKTAVSTFYSKSTSSSAAPLWYDPLRC